MDSLVIFAPHGSVDNPQQILYRPDVMLGIAGMREMSRLTSALNHNKVHIDVVVTSNLLRACMSAETIRGMLPNYPPLEIEPGFAAVNTPGWYGKQLALLEHAGRMNVWSMPQWCEETAEEVDQRLKSALDRTRANHKGETILVVSHEIELGMLQHRLENPQAETRIVPFPLPRGQAMAMQVGENRVIPLGIIKPQEIRVRREIGW